MSKKMSSMRNENSATIYNSNNNINYDILYSREVFNLLKREKSIYQLIRINLTCLFSFNVYYRTKIFSEVWKFHIQFVVIIRSFTLELDIISISVIVAKSWIWRLFSVFSCRFLLLSSWSAWVSPTVADALNDLYPNIYFHS